MPGRSDIAKQTAIRERMGAAQAGRPPGPATLDDVVAALGAVKTAIEALQASNETKFDALATLIGATNTALTTANGHLATIAIDVDRIP